MRYAALFLLSLSACNPFGCEDKTHTVELVPGDPFFNSSASLLDTYQKQGYECDGVAIRNASGREIGTRYTCTKCD